MELRKTFAANLRRYRRAVGISQEELGHQAELDRTYVSSLERCNYSASIDVIEKLASVLEIEPADLLVKPKIAK